jgi:hypothetical protein
LTSVITITEEICVSSLLPPNAADVQQIVEQRLAALDADPGLKETVTVEWRDDQIHVPVISMPLSLLSYNPGTHRVRAQRSFDPARDREIESAPFSEPAQAYLHQLLMADPADPGKVDPAFDVLKEDLREHSQSDPGIITRTGVLINGNTRRAALSELGVANIRVGVLPPDAGFEDLQSIELSLQLRRDHRRDYSFMNFLLAIEERVQAGWPPEQIQREFRIQSRTFERSRWILGAVEEAIERSKVVLADGAEAGLRLVDFETHQGKLEELYRAYTSLKAKAPAEAEALREQRLLAIALDKSKTDVRLIEADFAKAYMPQILKGAEPTNGATPVKIPGTSITVAPEAPEVEVLRVVTTSLLKAKVVARCADQVPVEDATRANREIAAVETALEAALDQAGRTGRLKKKRLAPVDRLSDANEDLQLAVAAVSEARATGTFDPADLEDGLQSLRHNLAKLAQLIGRNEAVGDGVAWLAAAASLPDTTD